MRKTPPYLKGLAETRARSDAEVRKLERHAAGIQLKLDAARRERDACDRLITKFCPAIEPSGIAPIRARSRRYGGYGELKRAILETVKNASPARLSVSQLTDSVASQFGLEFPSEKVRQEWLRNSIWPALRTAFADGVVERCAAHDGANGTLWRWRASTGMSLAELRDRDGASDDEADDGNLGGGVPRGRLQ